MPGTAPDLSRPCQRSGADGPASAAVAPTVGGGTPLLIGHRPVAVAPGPRARPKPRRFGDGPCAAGVGGVAVPWAAVPLDPFLNRNRPVGLTSAAQWQ